MNDLQSLDYYVDIVMCIDGTGSMYPIINEVKNNALSLKQKFIEAMNARGKRVEGLRIKLIIFRDYGCDVKPMEESEFFELDADNGEFIDYVSKINATGGGDDPENALEALALAIKSDWTQSGVVRRHVILMYTDAPALKLGERKDAPFYPVTDMPEDLAELHDWWEGPDMEDRAKRLIIFAPDEAPWSEMVDWRSTFLIPSRAGAGCGENDIGTCINLLANSI